MPYMVDKKGKVKRVSPPPLSKPPRGSGRMHRIVKKLEDEAKKNPPNVTSFKKLLKEKGSLRNLLIPKVRS